VAAAHPPAKLARLAKLANLVSLPARHFAVVDGGSRRTQVLSATVSRGRPRLREVRTIDAHDEGFGTAEEMREDVRQVLRELKPEAVVLVVPPAAILRHVLEVPPGDASETRALVEREASRIGGLSESPWVFDSVRLRAFGAMSNPVAAVFCRQAELDDLLAGYVDDGRLVFDVVAGGDGLAAAYLAAHPSARDAILVDLGAMHTGVTIVTGGQTVFSASFPTGSQAFTDALAAARGCGPEAAEVLKRTEPLGSVGAGAAGVRLAVGAWVGELERTVAEWRDDHPTLAGEAGRWPMVVTGGGALQPGFVEELRGMASRPVEAWTGGLGSPVRADQATAWGALLVALGRAQAAPSLLPSELRAHWNQQRLWRGLLTANLVLAAVLGVALVMGMREQGRRLSERKQWTEAASAALDHARNIRVVAEAYNARLEVMRPVLERQRQTVETLQVLGVLQRQRTNSGYWYVLLADGVSYASGSNDVSAPPAVARTPEMRGPLAGVGGMTNPPVTSRTFVAEVCLIPQGEEMRRALSELVGDLKQYPLFRNVDVLPVERRRELVATNLIYPERHFALELNLSEAELLPAIVLPRLSPTNREPARGGLRVMGRGEAGVGTNPAAGRVVRPR